MKLTLQSKNKKSSAKKNSEKKSDNKKKLSKKDMYYLDMSDLPKSFNKEYIPVNKLCYKHILYCDVLSIKLGADELELVSRDEIQLKTSGEDIELNSWARLLVMMLSTIQVNHPNNFLDYLMEKEITNQEFCVDKKYGKYTFEAENYRAFKIPNTDFYLEAIFKFDVIYKAFITMTKVLCMDVKETNVLLLNNKFNSNEKVIDKLEKSNKVHCNIKDARSRMNKNSRIRGVKILGTGANITSNYEIPVIFLNILKDKYKDNELEIFESIRNVGKTKITSEMSESTNSVPYIYKLKSGRQFYLYCDGELDSIIQFIVMAMSRLNIDINEFIVYIHQPSEWELE